EDEIVADSDGEVLQGHAASSAGEPKRFQHWSERITLEHGVGGSLADIGRRGGRQRGVGGTKRRRIVEAITYHQDLVVGGGELSQAPDLVSWKELGTELPDTEIAGNCGDRARPIARQDFDGKTGARQALDGLGCVGAQLICQYQTRNGAVDRAVAQRDGRFCVYEATPGGRAQPLPAQRALPLEA